MMLPVLETRRLRLRPFRDDDLEGLAALCADPEVMRYFPETLDRAAAAALGVRIRAHFDRHGFGPWSVEIKGETAYAGFIGLMVPAFDAHFTPCVEVGWRLAQLYWNRGYATEGAQAALKHGFGKLRCGEIVSMTVPGNRRSRAVMERLGMRRDPADDFDHPNMPEGHLLRRHVLYRLTRQDWISSAGKP
jgi:ribosomal-protein-alanine N-acetyltransferase